MGLAARTALALAATAVLAVGISAFVVSRGLDDRAREAAEGRLQGAAVQAARLAGDEFAEPGRWTRAAAVEVAHAARISGYRGIVLDRRGAVVGSGETSRPGATGASAGANVIRGGRSVGRVRLEVPRGQLRAEEDDLSRRVMGLDLLAGVLAVAGALLAVPLLAATVTRPIRRLQHAVDRLRDGGRAPEDGPPELAELGRRFNALSAGLAQEESARRGMAADVAHELRTPLNGLLLRIEAAQDGVLDDARRNLDAMHAEAHRLGALIEDVEALAEAERPGLLLERVPVDLARLAHERTSAQATRFANAGVELCEDLVAGAVVDGDPVRLAQVLDNLLTNALRYTDRRGRVDVRVSLAEDGGTAALEVADTGVGIAPEDLPHVFDRFWRADRSRTRATGGSGVGLAVVERLVAAHDGRVSVRSEPGRGTNFRVELPLARRPRGAEGLHRSRTTGAHSAGA